MQNHNIQICILIQLRFLRGNGDGKGLRWLCKETFAFPPCFPPYENFAKVESALSSIISKELSFGRKAEPHKHKSFLED